MMWSSLLCNTGTLDRITPHGVRMLRAMVNDSVLDVMYYMSHRFGPEVWVCSLCVLYGGNGEGGKGTASVSEFK